VDLPRREAPLAEQAPDLAAEIAHREFVSLVDMDTYEVRTHGIWSSHFAEAGVQRGMATPAFDQGRIVHDPSGAGRSEHGVHHFHSLLLAAYRAEVSGGQREAGRDLDGDLDGSAGQR